MTRFAEAASRRAYAGSAPITGTFGRSRLVLRRRVRNQRLPDAVRWWAFAATQHSPGAKAHYQPAAPPATGMKPPCDGWPASSSASSTTACDRTRALPGGPSLAATPGPRRITQVTGSRLLGRSGR
jgi:hypothetical protein